jgi:hypothetical protein
VRLLGRQQRNRPGLEREAGELDEAQALLVCQQAAEVALVDEAALEQHLAETLARANALLERRLELLLGQEPGPEDQGAERDAEVDDSLGRRGRSLSGRGSRGGLGHGEKRQRGRGGRLERLDLAQLSRLALLGT